MYKCPNCGAGLVFDPKSQNLQCLSCRNQFDPQKIEKMRLSQSNESLNQPNDDNTYNAISYKCSHCGAELITNDETISTFCSFCRTGTMIDRKTVKKRRPDYIIPFEISKEECKKIYVNKIKTALLAPKTMIETQEVDKIRGIYMPYWIYNYEKHGKDATKGSKYSHRSGDYIIYDDYMLETNVDAMCNGIVHDATSNFSDRLSEVIAPFNINKKKEFSPAYLSGYYADNEDVDKSVYIQDSHDIASNYLSKELRKDKTYHKYKAYPKIELNEQNAELALFPVYFLATRNKIRNRISYAVINGQTGKIAADIPIDIKKFLIIALILVIPIFFLLDFIFSFSIGKLEVCSIIFSILSMIILTKQNNKIEQIDEDKGKAYKDKINSSEKLDKKTVAKENKLSLSWIVSIVIILTTFFMFMVSNTNISYKQFKRILGFIILAITAIVLIIRKKNILKRITVYINH